MARCPAAPLLLSLSLLAAAGAEKRTLRGAAQGTALNCTSCNSTGVLQRLVQLPADLVQGSGEVLFVSLPPATSSPGADPFENALSANTSFDVLLADNAEALWHAGGWHGGRGPYGGWHVGHWHAGGWHYPGWYWRPWGWYRPGWYACRPWWPYYGCYRRWYYTAAVAEPGAHAASALHNVSDANITGINASSADLSVLLNATAAESFLAFVNQSNGTSSSASSNASSGVPMAYWQDGEWHAGVGPAGAWHVGYAEAAGYHAPGWYWHHGKRNDHGIPGGILVLP